MTPAVKQLSRCRDCGHFAINHRGGGGGRPASGRCVAPVANDDLCQCPEFIEGYQDPLPEGVSWYERAINAANRIDTVHTTPWKVALVYSLLAIAESLGASASNDPLRFLRDEPPPRRPGDVDRTC